MANRYAGRIRVTLKNVHRIENDGWGWRVLVSRAPQQKWRFFPDGPDGPFESLRAAIRWRDETWHLLGPARHARRKGSKPSTTGIVGVRREVVTQEGRVYEKYRATWIDATDTPRRRTLSIDRYGEEDAHRRAVKARRHGVAEADRIRRRSLLDVLHTHKAALP